MTSSVKDILRGEHVSLSRIRCHQACPHRFKLRYIDKRIPKSSWAAEKGKLVHAILERYLRIVKDSGEAVSPTLEDLEPHIVPVAREMREKGQLSYFIPADQLQPLLAEFCARMPRIDARAIDSVEARRITRIGQWKFVSVLDLVLHSPKSTQIVDFKTGQSRFVTANQVRVYALPILGSNRYRVEQVKCWYVFLSEKKIETLTIRASETQAIAESLAAQIRAMESDQTLSARPGSHCRWCDVRDYCTHRED